MPFFEKPLRPFTGQRRLWLILTVIIFSVFISVVALSGHYYVSNGRKNVDNSVTSSTDMTKFTDGLIIIGVVSAVDPIASTFRMQYTFVPVGTFSASTPPATFELYITNQVTRAMQLPTALMTVQIEDKIFSLAALEPTINQEFSLPFSTGDVSSYPVDKYVGDVQVFGSYLVGTVKTKLPIAFITSSALPLFNIDPVIGSSQDVIFTDYTITRSIISVVFAIFLITVMWMLSLMVFFMSVSLWVRRRKIEVPVIGVSTALLFALPALRNASPGVPPIGVLSDVVGFFWCMVVVAGAVCLNIANYFKSYKSAPKPVLENKETLL